ncbi:MAG: ABC transporter substrate-binding protein [Hyphomicrobiales bacterium]|nr:ABC transporter substrate-binding protein [Hyphomicrobiales bacterium]
MGARTPKALPLPMRGPSRSAESDDTSRPDKTREVLARMNVMRPSRAGLIDRRVFTFGAGAAFSTATCAKDAPALADVSASGHAIAMHGEPALPDRFAHFPYADPMARRGGKLVLGVQGTFDSLNPLVVNGNSSDAVPRFVLQSLMMRSHDEPFTLYGLLAQRIEISPSRDLVTFELSRRACFADAAPVTAQDVAFSFELLKAKGRPFFRAIASQVRAVNVIAAHTIAFDLAGSLNRETPLNLALLPVLPRHATDAAGFADTTLKPQLGSGPYAVAEVRPGASIVLRRNPNFWATDLSALSGFYNVDEIRYEFYRDANGLFEAFKAGLIDIRFEDEPARWVQGYDFPAVKAGRIVKETIPIRLPAGMNGFVFNTRREVFADRRVREALALLFDFEWVNANLFYGVYRRTAGFFDGSDLSSIGRQASAGELALLSPYRDTIPVEVLDGSWRPAMSDGSGRDRVLDEKALALLETSGWVASSGKMQSLKEGKPLAFEIMATSPYQERLALNYASSLSRIGVTARVRRVDEVQFWRRMQRFEFDMVQFNWSGTPSPGNELPNRWSSAAAEREGSLNYAAVSSKAVDACIDAVLVAASYADFADAVRALDRALIAGCYVVPLYHASESWLARSASIVHPAHTPLFGVSLDTVWRAEA